MLLLLLPRFIKFNNVFVNEFLKCLIVLAEKIHFHQIHQRKSLFRVTLKHLQDYLSGLWSYCDVLLKLYWCFLNEFDGCVFILSIKWQGTVQKTIKHNTYGPYVDRWVGLYRFPH